MQRNFLEDICKSFKQGEKVRKLLLDTKRKGEKIDQDIKRILLKREPFAEDSRSSSPESSEDETSSILNEKSSTSPIPEQDTDGVTGSNNVEGDPNVNDDKANTSQCSETDTDSETDDEEENTDALRDPTRVVELRADLENAQVDQEIVGLTDPATNSESVPDQSSGADNSTDIPISSIHERKIIHFSNS